MSVALPPLSLIASSTSSKALRLRASSRTCAPSRANFSATARPMPREAPVMSAMRSLRRCVVNRPRRGRRAASARRPFAISEPRRIFAGEAMVGELRMGVVAALIAHGLVDAVDREEGEAVGADELPHLFQRAMGGEQLVLVRRVDAVEIGMGDGRARNAHMHFACAGLAHHLHDLYRGRAAHHAVVDQHDALALDLKFVGAVLELDAELPDALLGLDEGAAHIMIADDAVFEGKPRIPANSRWPPARRNRESGR